jgi:DNA-binding MarR family transcriptional regulator
MALTGDLSVFNFADILQVLAKDRKSGVLLVEWKDIVIAYYIKDGELVFARPVDKVFRVYTDRDFDKLLDKLRIKKEDLFKTVEKFFLSRIGNKEGIFSFTPGFIRYNSDIPVLYPVEELIMRASRVLTPEEVERKISDELLIFEKTANADKILSKVKLTEEEKKVLELVDGSRSVADIRKASKLDSLTVDRALYGFLAAGIIRRKKKERTQKPSISLDLLAKIIERIKKL